MSHLIRLTGHRVLVPLYHALGDEPQPHIDPLYPLRSPARFRRDLDFMLRHFKPVDLPELLELCGHPQPTAAGTRFRTADAKPVFHITVDDGLRSAGEQMAVILSEKGVPATFFVNSAFVGNRALMYRYTAALIVSHLRAPRSAAAQAALLGEGRAFLERALGETLRTAHLEGWVLAQGYEQRGLLEALALHLGLDLAGFLARERPYLTLEELYSLQKQGFHIGSHSIDHPWYQDLPSDEQLRQTLESHRWVQSNLPGSPAVFAFPFSDAGLPWSCYEQGFEAGLRLHFGGPGLRHCPAGVLSRVAMEKDRSEAETVLRQSYVAALGKGMIKRLSRH